MSIIKFILVFSWLSLFISQAQPWQFVGTRIKNGAVLSSNELFAVGDKGLIVHSLDTGKSWSQYMTGTKLTLNGIDFYDQRNGFVVGDSGIVLCTNDKGNSWKRITEFTRDNLTDVKFINPSFGFIICPKGYIYKTTNAGLNWVKDSLTNEQIAMNTICKISQSKVLVAGDSGRIFVSINAGKSWLNKTTKDKLAIYTADFYDENNGIVAGADKTILKTQDGGLNWEFLRRDSVPFHTWWKNNIYSIKHLSKTTLTAFYENFSSGSWQYSSTNGGKNWDSVATYAIASSKLKVGQSNLFAFGFYVNSLDENARPLAHLFDPLTSVNNLYFHDDGRVNVFGFTTRESHDRGTSWGGAPGLGSYSQNVRDFNKIGDTLVGLPYTGAGSFAIPISSDNGKNWFGASATIPIKLSLVKFSFADNYNGIAMASATFWGKCKNKRHFILFTQNGGFSWDTSLVEGDSYNNCSSKLEFKDISMLDAKEGFMVAWKTVNDSLSPRTSHILYRTSDGGITWRILYQKDELAIDSAEFNSVQFVDKNTGFIGGGKLNKGHGAIYSTHDAGQTWKQEILQDCNVINSVKMLSNQIGFAIGNRASVFETRNGGLTWTKDQEIFKGQYVDSLENLEQLFLTKDRKTIYISGHYGVIQFLSGAVFYSGSDVMLIKKEFGHDIINSVTEKGANENQVLISQVGNSLVVNVKNDKEGIAFKLLNVISEEISGVKATQLQNGKYAIDITNVVNGVYFLNIKQQDSSYVKKIAIVK